MVTIPTEHMTYPPTTSIPDSRAELKAFEELELFIKLMKIKAPFEGWRALTSEISKVCPGGVSAVDANREQRIDTEVLARFAGASE